MNTFDHIYALARQIPYGTVATYGQLARLAGNPRMSRVVGYAMHVCPGDVPWHRVVDRTGRLCPGGETEQRSLLEAEGVTFTPEGKADLARHAWLGNP